MITNGVFGQHLCTQPSAVFIKEKDGLFDARDRGGASLWQPQGKILISVGAVRVVRVGSREALVNHSWNLSGLSLILSYSSCGVFR